MLYDQFRQAYNPAGHRRCGYQRSGKPFRASNYDEDFSMPGSLFMGFDSAESIDGLITILRSVRRSYFPDHRKKALTDTQRFDF